MVSLWSIYVHVFVWVCIYVKYIDKRKERKGLIYNDKGSKWKAPDVNLYILLCVYTLCQTKIPFTYKFVSRPLFPLPVLSAHILLLSIKVYSANVGWMIRHVYIYFTICIYCIVLHCMYIHTWKKTVFHSILQP